MNSPFLSFRVAQASWAALALSVMVSACGTSRPNNFVPTTDVPPTDMGSLMCTDPQIACRGACLDPTSDAMNCGACGNVCAAGQACVQGVCLGACPTGQTRCGTQCVDTQTDRTHCGACDAACGAGLVCSSGACRATCGPMYMRCDDAVSTDAGVRDAGAQSYCADVRTDERNCGGCGARCPVGQVCEDGACALHCPSAQTMCGDRCTSVQTDRANCGACGTACTGTQRCMMGVCTDQGCPGGFTDCTGACRDLMNDQANCGACGRACSPPGFCVAGMCRLDCPFGRTACGTVCANVQTDTANCGMCGRACTAGQVCEAGMCTVACPMGTVVCGGRCVDVSSDRTNCGACGTACPAGQLCTGGSCAASCAPTQITCAGRCVNAQSDPANCGACGITCPSGFACLTGICRPVAGADAAVCGAPSLRCAGTCTDPRTDNLNCGMCGNVCTTDRVCANGTCAAPCAAGQIRCGAACIEGQFDRNNCGACGNVCAAGQSCAGGRCSAEATLRIASLDTTMCTVVDVDSAAGDDRGGIALGMNQVFYNGDTSAVRASVTDLSAVTALASQHDALLSDLLTGVVYVLLDATGTEVSQDPFGKVDTTTDVTQLGVLDGNTGALTATRVRLSRAITVDTTGFSSDTGIFSGAGRALIHNGTQWFQIRLGDGTVTALAMAASPLHTGCENWAYWGVAEYFEGEVYAAYVASSTRVVRYRVRDAMITTVGTFTNLSDMCMFTVSPSRGRWYFHHEGTSQFTTAFTSEALGFCSARLESP